MTPRHIIEGPGRASLPGQPQAYGGFAAFFANDNHGASKTCPQGAAGLLLALEKEGEADGEGRAQLTIRLLLSNSAARPLLHEAGDAEDIIALWRGLGRNFNLPLYVADDKGTLAAFTMEPGALSHARRGASPLSGRRPRFLAKRGTPLKPVVLKPARRSDKA